MSNEIDRDSLDGIPTPNVASRRAFFLGALSLPIALAIGKLVSAPSQLGSSVEDSAVEKDIQVLSAFVAQHGDVMGSSGSEEQLAYALRECGIAYEMGSSLSQSDMDALLEHPSIIVQFFAALFVSENYDEYASSTDRVAHIMNRLALCNIDHMRQRNQKPFSQPLRDAVDHVRRSAKERELPSLQHMVHGNEPEFEEPTPENYYLCAAIDALRVSATEENGGMETLRRLQQTAFGRYVDPVLQSIQQRTAKRQRKE